MELWRKNKKKEKEKVKEARKCFHKNGSIFLQKLIADCNGISNPIRMFSSDQISKATSHFDPKCYLGKDIDPYFTWYKGDIEGRPYAIKIPPKRLYSYPRREDQSAYNDIVLSARVSHHNGFLKLMGCCLEYPCPVLVFEDLNCRVLSERGTVGCEDAPLLPWNARLKLAKEVAIAITYLHTAFPRITIHRNINAASVLLDKNGTAKLTDLSLAVTLPEGKSWILEDRVVGTYAYLDPVYSRTGLVTEYTDVFSFGIFMLVLLMGRPPYLAESDPDDAQMFIGYVRDVRERGEPVEFGGDSNDMSPGQMKMFLDLALKCCEERSEDRPKMIVVAKEIKLIEQASLGEDGQI